MKYQEERMQTENKLHKNYKQSVITIGYFPKSKFVFCKNEKSLDT